MASFREIDDLINNGYEVRIGDYISRSWGIFTSYLGEFIGYFVLVSLIHFGLGLIPILGTLASLAISGPLVAGFFIVAFKKMRDESVEFGDFFLGFNRFLPFFLVNFISVIFIGIGFILLIIPGIYLAVAYIFALPLIVDRNLDFWQAMEASRKVVTKNWFSLFALSLLLFLIILAVTLALIIGLIFALPLTYCIVAAAYEDIFGLAESGTVAVEAGNKQAQE